LIFISRALGTARTSINVQVQRYKQPIPGDDTDFAAGLGEIRILLEHREGSPKERIGDAPDDRRDDAYSAGIFVQPGMTSTEVQPEIEIAAAILPKA
jgi:hypothetical protein